MSWPAKLSLFFVALLLAGPAAAAGELPHALEPWDNAARAAMPTFLRVWLGFLVLSFLTSLVFVRKHAAARWALLGFIASHVAVAAVDLGGVAVMRRGLVSLFHVLCWGPAIVPLLTAAGSAADSPRFQLWSRVLLAVIAIAFLFDLRDAGMYLYYFLTGHPGLAA